MNGNDPQLIKLCSASHLVRPFLRVREAKKVALVCVSA